MRKFKVNEYITLKLENGKTKIYVYNPKKGDYEYFIQCLYVLLRKTINELEDFIENIDSVDEMAENLEHATRKNTKLLAIPDETRFWVHCSNLQVWVENAYDTRLIHSNLAFPLLKKLTEVGDPLAMKIFKEEIAKRFSTGYKPVIIYLIKNGYLNFLSNDEVETIIHTMEEENLDRAILDITELDLSDENGVEEKMLKKVPEIIKYCLNLKKLRIAGHRITELPEFIVNLKSLIVLDACNNSLEKIPNNIGELISLEELNLANNGLDRLPESIGNLKHLEEMELGQNMLKSLPESIGNLKSLKSLTLYYNGLKSLPDSIGSLRSLKSINLHHNKLESLPESIGNLKTLEYLNLRGNNFTDVPDFLKNLKSLKTLNLSENKILNPPIKIGDLSFSRDVLYRE
ncbi:MAG: leucine-rich repeat domain-containing protein [Promethearchaeota archaeon]|nr:MAG: leucine-rich repeat domain-containing protein [Candidatus Lokiarchaeota archaeon]